MFFLKKKQPDNSPIKEVITGTTIENWEEGKNHAPVVKDLMTVADGMKIEDSRLYISPSGYTKVYYVTALPSVVSFGYLDRFFQVGADIHVAIHVDPADSQRAQSRLTKMMVQIESEINLERKAGTNKNIDHNERMYEMLRREREELRSHEERLFYVTIIFSVTSPNEDEFKSACERIEREGLEGFLIRDAYMEHDVGFKSVDPIGFNALRHPIEMKSSALANAFPFSNSHFSHQFGPHIGNDFTSGHFNKYDAWDPNLPNANATIVGTSGSGKSFLIKGIIARSSAQGIRHVVVDYEGEYRLLTYALGGVTIRVTPDSEFKFNPFELEEEEQEMPDGTIRKKVDLDEKLDEMQRFIIMMATLYGEPLNGLEVSYINQLVQEMYTVTFGFTSDPESLYENLSEWRRDARGDKLVRRIKRPQPQFSDFFKALENAAEQEPALRYLVMRLRRFKASGTDGMFDTQSKLPESLQGRKLSDTHLLHFDLSDLSDKSNIRLLGMTVILEWVMEKFVKKNVKIRKRVVIDEAQEMLKQQHTAIFIDQLFRRIRKRSGSALAATQDFRKFAEHEEGRAIVQNSATKVLLKQDKNDKAAIMEVFKISEQEFDELTGYMDGQGRWEVNQEVFYNQFDAFDQEVELLNTRFTKSESELAKAI